jgi:hypothetical protein
MPAHKYRIGQDVHLHLRGYGRARPAADFRVERLLPADDGGVQYEVASRADGHRRVVREIELTESAGG